MGYGDCEDRENGVSPWNEEDTADTIDNKHEDIVDRVDGTAVVENSRTKDAGVLEPREHSEQVDLRLADIADYNSARQTSSSSHEDWEASYSETELPEVVCSDCEEVFLGVAECDFDAEA